MVNRMSRTSRLDHSVAFSEHRHSVYLGVAAGRQPNGPGLRDTVRRLIALSRICGGPEIAFCDEGSTDEFRPAFQATLSEVVRELLLNAICYSESGNASVKITRCNGNLRILVEDWGIGCDPRTIAPYRRGLSEVRNLVGSLGGSMRIDSRRGVGSCAALEIPLPGVMTANSSAVTPKPR